MALKSVASASSVDLSGAFAFEITGTSNISTITGMKDGELKWLYPSGAFTVDALGNLSLTTATATVGKPILITQRNGTVYEPWKTLIAADIPNLDASKITTGQLALARGGTHADLSATGGTNQLLKQNSAGADVTVGTIASANLSDTANIPLLNVANVFSQNQSVTKTGNAGTLVTATNSDASSVNASAQLQSAADTAFLTAIAHGTGRTLTRYGITLAGYTELAATAGNGLIIGATGAKPLIFGTNNVEAARFDSSQLMTIAKTITSYNGITTAGQGVAPVVGTLSITGRTTALGTTAIVTSAPAGLYLLMFHLVVTTAGTGGTIDYSVLFTDRFGAFTYGPITGAATASNGRVQFSIPIQSAAASNISISTTFTGVTGTPAYAIDAAVTRLV